MHLYLTAIAIQEEKIRQAQKPSQLTERSPIRSSWAEWSSRLLHRRDSGIADGSAALGARSGSDEGLARVVRNRDRSARSACSRVITLTSPKSAYRHFGVRD